MRKITRLTALLLSLPMGLWAQTTPLQHTADAIDSLTRTDSAIISQLGSDLAEARLSEAGLRLEIERLRLPSATDSLEQNLRRRRIDSLRHITVGYPVVVEGDTLFLIFAKRGGRLPATRASDNITSISALGQRMMLKPDSLHIEHSDISSDIMYGDEVIASITDQDGLWEGMPREELAVKYRKQIVEKIRTMNEQHGWREVLKRALWFVLVLVGQYLLFRLTNWAFRRLRRRICRRRQRFHSILIQNYELLDTYRQVRLLLFISHLARYLVLVVLLLLTVPMLFAIFPSTQTLAYAILSYIWTPFKSILLGIGSYVPNLFTIAVIWLVTRYAVRGLRYLATEVHNEKLTLGSFYPDWALPTFQIVRFLLYAFMVAMIYPYLPGSDSGIFKGISVFVGLIISLGSSTVVGNILAGLVITYMRPFRIGDRIRLNETTGKVIEKTAFVTRLRTPRNEVVTIPNSFIMSSHTVNYSTSAREYGLLIHSEVTIGYDTPWRKVHQLLIDAALATPGVVAEPEPFVLETSLSDYYPVYQLHACIRDADRMAFILSELNQQIQDRFAAAGVEIMSPSYTAYRNGNASTIPDSSQKNSKD